MALRLSSSSSNTTPTMYLNRVVDDTALSVDQKSTCLKYLSIILKNLADPVKSQEEKYRTLKLDNAKLQAGLFSIPAMMELLTGVFGFGNSSGTTGQAAESTTTTTLTVSYEALNQSLCQQTLIAIGECQRQMALNTPTTTTSSSSSSRLGTISGGNKRNHAISSSSSDDPNSNLSEKQKARRLLEERQQAEKVRAKEERKRNVALLKQDKLVRETDPNWKPGVSAACAKSGAGISTFRDRHGEQ
eukprot:CAMPEP_0117024544 /NCGR_PEP_ID=MMETSP0472-20121206/18214_1 /TAXON_ID=693140 ORGANISM="Tiarina fusus, Strain LIS" /NCGR_SAMPLE_ID=MMETSP0472 /ASSEMBLY_ACC=CAM_ASM_000603 /LENGTH=244 /DNA_ID=CAMNT_0004730999 /DNA_START=160 /DNA_END=894 /DNA_ORIENTATION=+